MKRRSIVLVTTLLLLSCAVQKKNYYYFDYYTYKRAPKATDSTNVVPVTATLTSVQSFEQLYSQHKTTVEKSEAAVNNETAKVSTSEKLDKQSALLQEHAKKISKPSGSTNKAEDRLVIKKSKPKRNGIGLLLGFGGLMALVVGGLLFGARRFVNRVTRWAKQNPRSAQVGITAMQLPLISWALMNGYNLSQLGYEISDTFIYGMAAATTGSYLTAPFLPKARQAIEIPKVVNRRRLAFMSMILGSLLTIAGFGNRIDRAHADTQFQRTVQAMDRAIFTSGHGNIDDPATASIVQQEREQKAGISAGAAAFLILLLICTTCAGVCLILLGASAGAVVGGILLLVLSFFGFKGVIEGRANRKAAEM